MTKPEKIGHKLGCEYWKENANDIFCNCGAKQHNDLCNEWEEYIKEKYKNTDSIPQCKVTYCVNQAKYKLNEYNKAYSCYFINFVCEEHKHVFLFDFIEEIK